VTPALRIGRTMERCGVLGPGIRAVIWVTGCPLRCKECIAPEFLDPSAGRDVDVASLARWVGGIDGIDGITLSGGEPFAQAEALSALLGTLRVTSPQLSSMAFTGYTLGRLRRAGTPEQRALLAQLDIVVDGPYVPSRHGTGRWRGSDNQRVHVLTDRHEHDLGPLDESAGIEVVIEDGGEFAFAGVPPTRGFRPALEARLREHGVTATTQETP
jgi:anaerobic ribonucleoside-triphosphate reductase activating protein